MRPFWLENHFPVSVDSGGELASRSPCSLLAGVIFSYTDSHLHFDTYEEEGILEDILARASTAGVDRMIAIGGSDDANERAVRLASLHPGRISPVVGYDRDEAEGFRSDESVRRLVSRNSISGIGETGLDYHYSLETRSEQRMLFSAMLDLAADTELPVVVHSREADDDTLSHLGEHAGRWTGDPGRLGVLHCFTGDARFALALLEFGYYISFSGIVTFRNAGELRQVAAMVPPERLLIETDAPYLAPGPHRGKRNEPAFVVHVAEAVAEVRHCPVGEVARMTSENAARLFG